MACVLCLQFPTSSKKTLYKKINSIENTQLRESLNTLFPKQFEYFKLPDCSICKNCFGIIDSFYSFYARVQSGYKDLSENAAVALIQGNAILKKENSLDLKQPPSSITEVIIEPNFQLQVIKNECEDVIDGPTTRRRSQRLGAAAAATASKLPLDELEIVQMLDIDIKNELEVPLATIEEVKPKKGRPSRARNKNISIPDESLQLTPDDYDVLKNPDNMNNNREVIKNPKTQRKRGRPSKKAKSLTQPDLKNISIPRQDDDNETTSIDELKKKAESKHSSEMKAEKIRLADEFIAAHFKLSCCICDIAIKDFAELKRHFRKEHDMRGYVLCCRKKLLKRGVLVDHLQTHKDPNYFQCKLCEKVMVNRQGLNMHMKNHSDSRERIYTCEICSKSFYRLPIYQTHMLTHVPEDQKNDYCPKCNKAFATKNLMNQHLRLVHLKVDAKICDICGKSVRGRDAFKRHQDEHKGIKSSSVQCELCGMSYSNKYRLKYHMKMMHTEENLKPQVCPICSKQLSHALALKRHMMYTHKTERRYACKLCGKAFKKNYTLREHMTTHTGEVLYTCPHCPKTFNSRANMHSHRKKAHRAEWEAARLERFKNKTIMANQKNLIESDVIMET